MKSLEPVIKMPRQRLIPSLEELYKRTDKEGDCRIWNGAIGPDGTPRLNKNVWGMAYARQFAYSTSKREVKQNQTLQNTCKNTLCVNPSHLTYTPDRTSLYTEFMQNVNLDGGLPPGKEYLGKCHLWTRTLSVDGRGRLNKDKWGETVVARWIYKFIKNLPNLPSNTTVNHRCDNANCVNPAHMYHKEDEEWNESNMKDCVGQGRIPGQVFVPLETQTPWERVAEIRRRILAGARTKDLCKEFNCSKVAIAGIKYNRTYKDESYTPP